MIAEPVDILNQQVTDVIKDMVIIADVIKLVRYISNTTV